MVASWGGAISRDSNVKDRTEFLCTDFHLGQAVAFAVDSQSLFYLTTKVGRVTSLVTPAARACYVGCVQAISEPIVVRRSKDGIRT
jgi:hypothetical protein